MTAAVDMFVTHPNNCFQLFGFDVLLDAHCRPWLLEVNFSPSLNTDAAVDLAVKGRMLADLFTLVGVPLWDCAADDGAGQLGAGPVRSVAAAGGLRERCVSTSRRAMRQLSTPCLQPQRRRSRRNRRGRSIAGGPGRGADCGAAAAGAAGVGRAGSLRRLCARVPKCGHIPLPPRCRAVLLRRVAAPCGRVV